MIDSKISKIQKDFNYASELLESSKINLTEAENKLSNTKLASENLEHSKLDELEPDLKEIQVEFENKLKKLYSNHQDLIQNLHNTYSSKIKKKIIEETLKAITNKVKMQQIEVPVNLENISSGSLNSIN